MNDEKILSHVDHTLLTATACEEDVEKLCREAEQYKTASVCIPPCYVGFARENFPGLNIGTVIGFPLGYDSIFTKAAAVRAACKDTADEIDMVINLTDVKNGRFSAIEEEISVIRDLTESKVLKVIIETCYLTQEEKIAMCKIVTETGADYIKTSTGFGTAGATPEDVELFKKHIGSGVKIKASGGIRTREDMVCYLQAGVERLGTSSAVKILCGGETGKGY